MWSLLEMFPRGSQSGVWLLAAQKPMKRQYWWKGRFALFWRLAAGVGVVDSCLMTESPVPHWQAMGKSVCREREGYLQKQHGELWWSSWSWPFSDLTSIILTALGRVNLQFQGRFVPISWGPVLGTVAAHVTATVWLSCSQLLHPVGL